MSVLDSAAGRPRLVENAGLPLVEAHDWRRWTGWEEAAGEGERKCHLIVSYKGAR